VVLSDVIKQLDERLAPFQEAQRDSMVLETMNRNQSVIITDLSRQSGPWRLDGPQCAVCNEAFIVPHVCPKKPEVTL
jgi:hypothetical protein